MEKSIIQIAASQIGIKEIKGKKNNEQIVNYAKETKINVNGDETPWCSIFVNWCAKQAGLQMTNKANARSWMYVGRPVDDPRPGDVIVLWRESPDSWKGHVGLFFGYSKDFKKVFVLGGNQGDSVSVASYDARKVLGFRRLTQSSGPELPSPTLTVGSRGEQVRLLQLKLDEMGYDPGGIDGVYGQNTRRQLASFQRKEGLEATGIFDQSTYDYMENNLVE
ncbi:MAG: TIGR02594 family protein [Cyclobacteriaceae bacterium]